MTTKHNISRAAELYAGDANHPGLYGMNGRVGVPLSTIVKVSLGTPALGDADGLGLTQDGTALDANTPAALTVTEMDVPRNVTITSAGDDSGITFTVTGTDVYGEAVVETITGANAGLASGKKAFKTVTEVQPSAAAAGNISIGFGDVLGLPYRLNALSDVLAQYADGTEESASSVFVAGVGTAATATTGDVRGTVNPDTTLDGSVEITVAMFVNGSTAALAGGVPQYGG